MATVWRGHDLRLWRDVAIKVCAPEAAGCPRAIREEQFSSTLQHPNIVSVFDAGDIADSEAGNVSFIVMEYVQGTTAQQVAPVSWHEAIRIVRQAADGLAAAHERGIVHCDVKPGNLLIDNRGRVLVADFGIAMPVESEIGEYVHGSPAYLAPERLAGEPADPRVDVYGLAGVLEYLITGSRPSSDAISLPLSCPPQIARVIARAKASNPYERYSDAREFRIALDGMTKAIDSVPVESTLRLRRDNRVVAGSTHHAMRRVIRPPYRAVPNAATDRPTAQETAAMSSFPVSRSTSSVVASRARTTQRSNKRRWATLVLVAVAAVVTLLAGSIVLRDVASTGGMPPGPAPVVAAVEMPAVEGQSLAMAVDTLSGLGIDVDRVDVIYEPGPSNQIVAQVPEPGTTLSDDDVKVTLVVRANR
jgi:serine/threonine protein kinase